MNKEIWLVVMPIWVAYTGAKANTAPAAAPLKNIVTTPVGTIEKSVRKARRSNAGSCGALDSESAIGTSEIETSTEAITKSSKPVGSATFKRSCPSVTPPRDTTMYSDSVRPRVSGVAWSLSQLSVTT